MPTTPRRINGKRWIMMQFFEKITSCKVALGKVISDNEWVSKLRKAVDTMTQIRFYGTRAFSDDLLYAMINEEFKSKLRMT